MTIASRPYEIVVGLEVHVELGTRSKIFCGCSTAFGSEPNSQTCPVCLGMPGVLPVLNEQALEYAIRAALALNCAVQSYAKFDRKQYFYPDLPKGYQISQFDLPLALRGWVEIETGAEPKRIGITRIHMEEDAGKLVHIGNVTQTTSSFVDLNRCGVPLIEIVSEPDIRSADQAKAYLEQLRSTLVYTGVSEAKLQEGQMRCDVNISVRPVGATALGTRTELKNLSSFRSVVRAIEYEAQRQWEALQRGETIVQETRNFDEEAGVTRTLRSKEEAHDYRYFPEPDLLPIVLSPEKIAAVHQALPELPHARRARYVEQYGLSEYDAGVLVLDKQISDFFDATLAAYTAVLDDQRAAEAPKLVANWTTNNIAALLNEQAVELKQSRLTPEGFVDMLKLVDQGTITRKIAAEQVLPELLATDKDPATIVQDKGLVQVSDTAELEQIALAAIVANPKVVEDWQKGKAAVAQFFVGQIMKATRGRANPQLALQVAQQKLAEVTGITNA